MHSKIGDNIKNFLEPAMFCHLAYSFSFVERYKGKVKDPRYMQNKKDFFRKI
jgi:hypothetical protein